MLIESVGGNAEASRLTGIRSRSVILLAYVFSGLCAGIAGLMISSNVSSADGNNAGLWIELDAILAVVIGGTALTGGRYFLAGTIVGALIDPDADDDDLLDRHPAGDDAAVQGARRHRRLPRCSRPPSGPRSSERARTAAAARRQVADAARAGGRMSTVAGRARRSARPRIPQQYLPVLATLDAAARDVRRRRAALPGLRLRPGDPEHLHRQRVPARRRRRHDVRDPDRRHRPLGRRGRRAVDRAVRDAGAAPGLVAGGRAAGRARRRRAARLRDGLR